MTDKLLSFSGIVTNSKIPWVNGGEVVLPQAQEKEEEEEAKQERVVPQGLTDVEPNENKNVEFLLLVWLGERKSSPSPFWTVANKQRGSQEIHC
jgi:hypothetical protein